MSLHHQFKKLLSALSTEYAFPPITDIFLPPLFPEGQPKNYQFIAVCLEDGAAGVSYILIPKASHEKYQQLQKDAFIGRNPSFFAEKFGIGDPIDDLLGLASLNALCQHVIKKENLMASTSITDTASDPFGLLQIQTGDKLAMVGLFYGMADKVIQKGAELVILEKNKELIKRFPNLPITDDSTALQSCNKILCTSTTVLNNSLEEILAHCDKDATLSLVGPTAGYLPDPLFALGVDIVGGRIVTHGFAFMERIKQGKKWDETTQMVCFQKKDYTSRI